MLPTVILKSWNTKFSEKSINPTTGSQVSKSCQQEVKSQIPHLQMCKFYSVSKGKSLWLQGKKEVHSVAKRSRKDPKEKRCQRATSPKETAYRAPKAPTVFLLDILSVKQAPN